MATQSPQRLKVFLSYAHEDQALVLDLYRRLISDGFEPWLDREQILPGQNWELTINRAVRAADIVIACLSIQSVSQKGFVHAEIQHAITKSKEQPEGTIYLIPLRLEACDLPDRLAHLHAINYYEVDTYTQLRRALQLRAAQLGRVIAPDGAALLDQTRRLLAERRHGAAIEELTARLAQEPANRDAAAQLAQIAETAAVPFAQRVQAARVIGPYGDPRTPIQLAEWHASLQQRGKGLDPGAWDGLTPPGYWRFLPSTIYQIGAQQIGISSARLHLRAFWIARLPITVAQYTPFVQQGGGAPPRWWGSPSYTGGNQPVIGITWRQASQFCAWLTGKLAASLPPGYSIRLPTEAEWEAAASYDALGQRRPYPWGDAPLTMDHAVHALSQHMAAAPVGCCPAGAAACGALDLAGNVWELTSSEWWDYPHYSDRHVGAGRNLQIVWRGGGWYTIPDLISSGTRGWIKIDVPTDPDGGFRIALAPRL